MAGDTAVSTAGVEPQADEPLTPAQLAELKQAWAERPGGRAWAGRNAQGIPGRHSRLVGRVPSWFRAAEPSRVRDMERNTSGELVGQTSINELLDETVGASPTQLLLPILVQVKPGQFRRLS